MNEIRRLNLSIPVPIFNEIREAGDFYSGKIDNIVTDLLAKHYGLSNDAN
jgi:hypothetical protein